VRTILLIVIAVLLVLVFALGVWLCVSRSFNSKLVKAALREQNYRGKRATTEVKEGEILDSEQSYMNSNLQTTELAEQKVVTSRYKVHQPATSINSFKMNNDFGAGLGVSPGKEVLGRHQQLSDNSTSNQQSVPERQPGFIQSVQSPPSTKTQIITGQDASVKNGFLRQ